MMWPKKGLPAGSKMGERAVHGRFSPDPRPVAMELNAREKPKPITANEVSSSPSPRPDPRSFVSGIISGAADYSSQLVSHFVDQKNRSDAEKVVEEAKREMEAAHSAASRTLPDLSPFMTPVAAWELKYIRRTSHLCSLTYKQPRVTPSAIRAMHNLELVASSWAYPFKPFDALSTAEDIEEEGDGMGAAVREIKAASVSKGETWMDEASTPSSSSSYDSSGPTSVTRRLVEAASAASGAAAMAAGPLASAAGSIYAGFQSLPLPGLPGSSNNNSPPSTSSSSGQLGGSQTVKLVSALADVAQAGGAQITSALASSIGPASAPTSSTGTVTSTCPSHWFVVDDCVNHLRTFVIQGSDTIDHWRLNLTFDPVSFEDPSLGVTVHRGVYEAARVLYSTFLPLVKAHLASSPLARVTFTGHSIGGSIATLLLFMYKHNHVLDNKHISTVYTFGSPTVFCEGPGDDDDVTSSADTSLPTSSFSDNSLALEKRPTSSYASVAAVASSALIGGRAQSRAHEGGPSRLMSSLGLQERVVRNCIMHRDIVPRAFACDYSLVAEILRGWGAGFARHCSLGGDGRKHLYYYVGRLIVLQPDSWHSFVGEGDDHPLLPPGPGLYYLSDPEAGAVPKASPGGSYYPDQARVGGEAGSGNQLQQGRRVLSCAHEAVMELMDNPHPLETLADPKAYLPFGSISRYHNPDNYTQAFGRIKYLTRQVERSSGVVSVAIRRSNGRPDPLILSASRDTFRRLAADMMDLRSDGNAWLWDSSDEDDKTPINVDPIGSYHS